jgi:hypothetical protein
MKHNFTRYFAFTSIGTLALFTLPGRAFANTCVTLGVPISSGDNQICGTTGQDLLRNYILALFTWGARAIGTLAVLVVIFGGYTYMTSGGNPDKVERGKNLITGAVSGVLLVIFAYVILKAINPASAL